MTNLDPLTTIDESTLIDRMIDGALTPAQLRTAIARLDQSPDGWKRCALAFIEAQSWQQAFQVMSPTEKLRILSGPANQDPGRPRFRSRRWIQAACAAAIVAVALTVGWFGSELAQDEAAGDLPRQPFLSVAIGNSPFVPIMGPLEERTVRLLDQGSGTWMMVRDSPETNHRANPPIQAIGQLRLATGNEVAQVPILGGPGLDETWLRNQPPALTREQLEFYQSQGYEVQQRRRIMTAKLGDGRQINVPIDDVQIRQGGKTSL